MCGVCVLQPVAWGAYIGVQGRFPRAGSGGSKEVEGRAATTWPVGRLVLLTNLFVCHNTLPRDLGNVPARFGPILWKFMARWP
jgi:hypothetical protein